MKDTEDFYVEDEAPEQRAEAWKKGIPVIVYVSNIGTDYEARGLIMAYLRGDLDEAGIELLSERLEEYGMTINDI